MTDVIDVTLSASAFPPTYTGVGTLLGNTNYSNPVESINGFFTSDGNAVSIPVGFAAQEVEIFDETDNVSYVWKRGLAAGSTIKTVAAGTVTVDTGAAIAVTTTLQGKSTILLSAAAMSTAKLVLYSIQG